MNLLSINQFTTKSRTIIKNNFPNYMEDDKLMDHLNNPTNILNYALNISSILDFLSIRKMPIELKHKTQNFILKIFKQTIWQECNSFMISEEKLNNITKKSKIILKNHQKTLPKQPISPQQIQI